MTRLPVRPRIAPSQGLLFVQAIQEQFTAVALSEREYFEVIADASERGIAGGKIYDALILRCAQKANAERIYTWNLHVFHQLADPKLANRIIVP